MSVECSQGIQTNLLDFDAEHCEKMRRIDKALDKLNKIHGSETVIIGTQQFRPKDASGKATSFADAIRYDFKSPNYTTRWSDIIELK